ncbi:MAG TPA: hypothetical protein VGN16_18855 [Acidobacteriaceae bacterium]|jgi:hypothetical protein
MSTDKEWQRLYGLYANQGDGQLLALYEQRDGLTAIAQEALTKVMQERELVPHAVEDADTQSQDNGATTEREGSFEGELGAEEQVLYSFTDGSEAANAKSILLQAGITHRFSPQVRQFTDGRSQPLLALVVNAQDSERTEALLREAMGLFPLPEGPEGLGGALGIIGEMTLLVMFDGEEQLDEALAAAEMLAKNGISFLWRDGRDAPEALPDASSVALEVRRESLGRAQELLEQLIAALPEE